MKRFALLFSTLSLLLPWQFAWAGSCFCLARSDLPIVQGLGSSCIQNVTSDECAQKADQTIIVSPLGATPRPFTPQGYDVPGGITEGGVPEHIYVRCQYYSNNSCAGEGKGAGESIIEFQPSVAIPGGQTFGEGQKTIISPNTIGEYIRDVVNFLTAVAAILAIVMIMLAGLRWVFSAGSPEKITKAKEGLINALMGLALALGSWMILFLIGGKSLTQFKPITPTYIRPETDVVTGQPIPEQKCDDCQEITSVVSGVFCKNNCQAAPSVVAALGDFKQMTDDPAGSCPYKWRVTEAWKATSAHDDPAHYNGHAIDVNFDPPYQKFYDDLGAEDQNKVDNFERCLGIAGFRVLNEYKTTTRYTTAPHFHLNR